MGTIRILTGDRPPAETGLTSRAAAREPSRVVDQPPAGILAAFGLAGTPVRLPGGQGACWRAGPVVLKPDQDPAQGSWLAEAFAELVFRTVTESLARYRSGRDSELATVRRATEPVTDLLLARAAVLDSGS
jgi:hypothetical protein